MMNQKRQKKILTKKSRKLYGQVFDLIMYVFTRDLDVPNNILKKVDDIADYLGDVATGRIK